MDLLNHLDDIEYKIGYLKQGHTSFVKALYSTNLVVHEIKTIRKGSNGQPNDQSVL
jgi:hypothetical protein